MNETFSDLDSIIQLSKDQDTLGFDLRAGKTWIYPTNYPVRDYQYNITQSALYKNTLVSLPTGLGKTFIAAVVMYNFYRWYPMGKIIFMAPTKPLVGQQMEACYNIMAIPVNNTVEMTGTKMNKARAKIWQEKRVFFITPHILQNDIDTILELAPQIRCIVIDEAHRALGKNANCEAIRKIQKINRNFRVLALSATPGKNFDSIKAVITNLLISHIEVRTNESIDVAAYGFQRKLETFVIPIRGKLLAIKNEFIKVLDKYTRPLVQSNIVTGNCANLTKGRLVFLLKEFKERGRQGPNHSYIMKTLNICVTLYHAYELLIGHGLRSFLVFFENSCNALINSIRELNVILEDVKQYLGPIKEVEMLPDGTIPEVEGEIVFSHPKFEKLSTILLEHFNKVKDADTRVMVFCEYRESVKEIYGMLLRHRPLVKPRVFLGQGDISQAQQVQTVKLFRSGACNTLVSTCIGEEGLDVGEVDLIVCFDNNSKSPIRMVQRMGRTGRKRDGHIIVLVTEGKEQQSLTDCLVQKNNMSSLLESQPVRNVLYKDNPKMIPDHIKPECNKMFITVEKLDTNKTKAKKKPTKNTIKDLFQNISSKNSEEISDNNKLSTKNNKKSNITKNKGLDTKKQSDIRNLFSNLASSQSSKESEDFAPRKQNYHQRNLVNSDIITTTEELPENNCDNLQENVKLTNLITSIENYLKVNIKKSYHRICEWQNLNNTNSANWIFEKPSESIFDKITCDSLKLFENSIKFNNEKEFIDNDDEKSVLNFFGLDSLSDLWSDDSDNEHFENEICLDEFNSSKISQIIKLNSSKLCEKTRTDSSVCDKIKIDSSKVCVETERNLSKTHEQTKLDLLKICEKAKWDSSKIYDKSKIVEITSEGDSSQISKEVESNSSTVTENNFMSSPIFDDTLFENDDDDDNNVFIDDTDIEKSPILSYKNRFFSQKISTSNADKNSINKNRDLRVNNKISKNLTEFNEPIMNIKLDEQNEQEYNFDFWDDSLFECKMFTPTQLLEFIDQDSDCEITNHNLITNKTLNQELEKSRMKIKNNSPTQKRIFNDLEIGNSNSNINKTLDQESEKQKYSTMQKDLNLDFEQSNIENKNCNRNLNGTLNQESKRANANVLENFNFDLESDEDSSLLSFPQKMPQRHLPNKPKKLKLDSQNYKSQCSKDIVTSGQPFEKTKNSTTQASVLKDRNFNLTHLDLETLNQESKICRVENGKNSSTQVRVLKDLNFDLEVSNLTPQGNLNSKSDEESSTTQRTSQQNLANKHKKLKLDTQTNKSQRLNGIATISSESDDDFDMTSSRKIAKSKITPQKKGGKPVKNVKSVNELMNKWLTHRKVKKPTALCDFIDDEAVVEFDENYVSDSDVDDDSEQLESSFISNTQTVLDQTDMQAKYLQSVRSPHKVRNAYKMPAGPPPKVYANVFSQNENNQDDTYMNDSFCVDNEESLAQVADLTCLEVAEMLLEKERRKKKQKKRKRIITVSSDDSS